MAIKKSHYWKCDYVSGSETQTYSSSFIGYATFKHQACSDGV